MRGFPDPIDAGRRAPTAAAAALLCTALAACGGDGGDDDVGIADDGVPAGPSPAGLWRGTTGDGRALEGLVLGDGTFRFLYSAPDDAATLAGVVAGAGEVSGTTLSASRGLDHGLGDDVSVRAFALRATFSPGATLDGTLDYEAGFQQGFTSVPVGGTGDASGLDALAGDWSGTVVNEFGTVGAGLSIAPDGALAGDTDDGCTFAGRFLEIAPGLAPAGAWAVAIDGADAATCAPDTAGLEGLAWLDGDGRLAAVLRDPSLAAATVFAGRRSP